MQPVSRSRVLRSSLGRVLWSIFGVVLVGLPVLVVLAVYASGDPGAPPFGLIVGLVALVLAGAFMLRLAMVKVVLHDDHVELVNPLRRFRFYWSDVEDIDIISSAGWIVRVWAGGVPRWAWGTSRIGQFGAVPFASVHDDPAKDAPPRVYEGYRELRAAWTRGRR
jgi:PH (Pleckstrin Homology) domain-containing protein